MAAWFDEDPARLRRETSALEAAGLEYTLDVELRREHEVLRLRVAGVIAGDENVWNCDFPDGYPYFPPVVTGEDRGYRHHHNPVTGQHCLLREGEGHWKPSMTLADLLVEQWPKFLQAQDAEAVAEAPTQLEVRQGEPWSAYFRYEDAVEVVLWDSALEPPVEVAAGFVHGLSLGRYGHRKWLATGVIDVDGNTITSREVTDVARRFYDTGSEQALPWVRLSTCPDGAGAGDWWWAAAEAWGRVKPRQGRRTRNGGGAPNRILITFPEEVAHRELGWGWAVVHDIHRQGSGQTAAPHFQRVVRTGAGDLVQRAPQLAGMRTKRILVVGLGGLGSQIVRLLAPTCPAALVLWDRDRVDADTAIRWPGALAADGQPKAAVLAGEVMDTQTYTAVDFLVAPVGVTRGSLAPSGEPSQNLHDVFLRHLSRLDLIIDAAADRSVQHYLSDQARLHRVAYLRADAQYGVWSGMVALQRAEAEVCWMCWAHHSADGTLPTLPRDPAGEIQPPGCGHPTYVGAGFDLAAIAAEAVRVTTSYLCQGRGAHPHDVMTLRLRDQSGALVVPTWQGVDLERHAKCPNH